MQKSFSVVLPFYNEENCVEDVVRALVAHKRKLKLPINFVLVDNGSRDNTAKIIDDLIKDFKEVKKVTVKRNKGYGYGIKKGLQACRSDYVGFMCGDGQTDVRDVSRVVQTLMNNPRVDLCKVNRITRHDGLQRKVVSYLYNILFRGLFSVKVEDVNGTPKIFKKKWYKAFKLKSDDWFIDAEIMLKANENNLNLMELPVVFYIRKTGSSKVKLGTMFEFLKNMFIFKGKGDL